jgi:hypothetical protein
MYIQNGIKVEKSSKSLKMGAITAFRKAETKIVTLFFENTKISSPSENSAD